VIGSRLFRRVTRTAADLRREHGLLRGFALLTLRGLARLTGGTVLACMHKPVSQAVSRNARLLTRAEIERASTNASLDLPADFVASSESAQCYGIVVNGDVRCYAWTSTEPVRAVPGTVVRMAHNSAYVYKAFTDPAFRGQGLLRECLSAVEQRAVSDGSSEMSALVEIHNRSSLRGFRNAGFTRCGLVFVLKRPWLVSRVGCQCATPCTWTRDSHKNPAAAFRSSTEAFARRS
jgi:ribosomal protein S18 acetylase RimI-like enzyme